MIYKEKVLIVDDVPENIQVVMGILREENYDLFFATNGLKALELIEQNSYDLILLDIMMPIISGLDVCRKIRSNAHLKDLPIIFLTAKTDIDSISEAFEIGGVDYITKPFHANELLARVKTHLDLYRAKTILKHANLELENRMSLHKARLLGEIEENQKDMVYLLMTVMEAASDETCGHMKRVAEYTKLLAHYHPIIQEDDLDTLYMASLLHDIGKISIATEILHKPALLTADEYKQIKTHTDFAKNILQFNKRKLIKTAEIIAHEHHERWDGSGYPRGLKGNDIHIFGRIVGFADTLDALSHKRVYKEAWKIEDIIEYIKNQRSKQFDPELVDIFLKHQDEFITLIAKLSDTSLSEIDHAG